MPKCKLEMTRPEFLMRFIADDDDNIIPLDEVQKILPESADLIYCAYTVLMESNVKRSDISFIHNDGETIVAKFSDKSLAKTVKGNFNKEVINRGIRAYQVKVKEKDRQVFISIERIENDE